MITQQVWMALGSYENLRKKYINTCLINLLHLGPRAFEEISGEKVQTVSFIIKNVNIKGFNEIFCRLVDEKDEKSKEEKFLKKDSLYLSTNINFDQLPGCPISAYRGTDILKDIYSRGQTIGELGTVRIGMGTGNNDIFLKTWWEVAYSDIQFEIKEIGQIDNIRKYVPYSKGGERKRWYGNQEFVIWYNSTGRKKMAETSGHRENGGLDLYFHRGITWSYSTMGAFSARIMPDGFVFDVNGSSIFMPDKYFFFTLGFLQSSVARFIIDSIKSAFSIQAGTIRDLPILTISNNDISDTVNACIKLSRDNWDSYETSWDFKTHPLYNGAGTVDGSYNKWNQINTDVVSALQQKEEYLNKLFIAIYGLREEVSYEVNERDITIERADLGRDIRSLISYAIGCMFGRYSLDKEGLIYAGGDWKSVQSVYKTFLPDQDNVIPITDQKYLDDDVVERICEFLTVVYGAETLEENLDFIAKALGNKGLTSREVIRNYMLNDFFKDHCKIYSVTGSGKRPIYWLFDSGKENAFKALVYMHRWDADTTGRVLLYAQQIQQKYETEIRAIDMMLDHITDARQKSTEEKRQEHLKKQLEELVDYEERLEHMANERIAIDLDDGVKVNYEKVQTDRNGKKYQILAPIK